MASAIKILLFALLILLLQLQFSTATPWIRAGYWLSGTGFRISDINSALFTHLIAAFADLNNSTYRLSISSSNNNSFSAFSTTVKQRNPSLLTLLSIGGGLAISSDYSSMISQRSSRESFIESAIAVARVYGFDGLDFCWVSPSTDSDMANLATLFDEWRAAIESESKNSSNNDNKTSLILTMAVHYSPFAGTVSFPIESIRDNLDWVHLVAYDYYMPTSNNTGAFAALYDPSSQMNTDFGVNAWINGGLPAGKIVLGLPFYAYLWTLVNPADNGIGAPANGVAITPDGSMSYRETRAYIRRYNGVLMYNATYVVNYCSIGSSWMAFDDVGVVRTKVDYAKKRNLHGYYVWQVTLDDNSVLSQAAAQEGEKGAQNKRNLLPIILPTAMAVVIIFLSFTIWCIRRMVKSKESKTETAIAAVGSDDAPHLQVFSFGDIKAATDDFCFENKLGEGGYGPVYKGILRKGQEMAVKRLSKTSTQGYEEFKNEVILTSKLQHVNLVRLLGFCTEREEKMLIYEYLPNKSLDFYIYDPIRRLLLDWEKRVNIIEGVIQGLLYLQEYSRLTIIHRDLKVSNILLDYDMKPKISDFGLARIFEKDELEANTSRIVGTYGYVPPEYVKHGIYSTKSDVFSFGVLLLQIISGKRNSCLHGPHKSLNLLEYAYELWKEGKGMEFMDPDLDDASSPCKLMKCMQIALLCVQENPVDRPSMLEISSMLKNETLAMNSPKKPAFHTKANGSGEVESTPSEEIYSVNNVTMTEMVAR